MTASSGTRKTTRPPSAAPQAALRALGYVRVSTEEQGSSGAGLEAQRQAIQTACRDRGFDLLEIYQDVASGKSMDNRPELTACLALLDAHRADALVVAKLDRLSRSLLDFANTMERAGQKGWAIVAIDLGVDTTGPSGKLIASVMASFAEFERRLIGQRTKDALAVKRAQGVKLGRPSNIPEEVVLRILGDYESFGAKKRGAYSAIARRLTAEGVPTGQGGSRWYPSVVRHVVMSTQAEESDTEGFSGG